MPLSPSRATFNLLWLCLLIYPDAVSSLTTPVTSCLLSTPHSPPKYLLTDLPASALVPYGFFLALARELRTQRAQMKSQNTLILDTNSEYFLTHLM